MRNVLLAVMGLMTFAGPATSAPVPKALLKKPEPTRIPLTTAMERVERQTGLMFLSNQPVGGIELDWPWTSGEKPSSKELFSTLNVQLQSHGYVLTSKTQSFRLVMIQK